MPTIDGKEYPRLENGVIVYAPPARPTPKPTQPAKDDKPKATRASKKTTVKK